MTVLTESPNSKTCSRFITIYEPIGGWNAVMYWWNQEDGGFWEPWQTGFGPYYGPDAKQEAIVEGNRQKAAAQADIVAATTKAKEDLRKQVSALAVKGAEKLIKREIDGNAHKALLDELAAEI